MKREEAIEWLGRIEDRYIHGGDEGFDNARRKAIDMAIEALQREKHLVELEAKAVAIIKSERHGEWEEHTVANTGKCLKDSIECSVCGYLFCRHDLTRKNYCPNCGAKMDKEKEDG
jgi:rubrerythrin